jgi:hypothetical protein
MSERVQTFVSQMVGAVEDLALLFAHQPNDAVEAALAEVRANLRADFVANYPGVVDWDVMLDGFVQFVLARKAEIETHASGVQ